MDSPMTDTPATLEERLRRNSGWRNERHQCVTDPNLLTEAADEIASLRARVEALDDELTEAVEHLEAVLFSDPGPKMLASIGSARAWWMKRDAREEVQALKDTPDE